ncbi:MAG: Planctomycete cytochrome [Planctomycetaceae bacterium]|nr:Planctomycete cytochrome [Planctomycetaceae bacterium]
MLPSSLLFAANWKRRLIIAVAGLLFAIDSVSAEEQASSAVTVSPMAQLEFFETQVRPLLVKRCYKCHSTETGADNGALILDTVPGIAAGGSRGAMFSKEMPEKGLLQLVLGYADPDLQMPPAGKLPATELAVFERWIRDGAALPEYKAAPRPKSSRIDFLEGQKFWSFQPVSPVEPPVLQIQAGVSRPMDLFIRAKLGESKLTPNPEADRAALLRRVTFDLIGLPPTPAELDAFLQDDTSEAYERVVERLLASPHFGERWARVWLDLARYTDDTPDWQNPTDRGWLYRDWIVRAMNQNLPYDQFVRLQLAADLIPDTLPQDRAALGFIGLSPTYWKELRLAPAVIEQIVADEWDERIDAVSRTFLGLTVSCARCHDHKFDPISAEDYYGLAGVFASTQFDEQPLLPSAEAQVVRAARKQVKDLTEKLKSFKDKKGADAQALEKQVADIKSATPHFDEPFAHVLREASVFVLPDGTDATKLEYREVVSRDLPVFRRGNPSNPGDVVPRRFLTVFQPSELTPFKQGSGRVELADSLLTKSRGLLARVIVNRIWDQHFQGGLVRTPSDFGAQGDRPTHPALLEYLAYQFVARGWDLKWLHREIVLSATYRQSTSFRPEANAVDPANHLLWRMNRRSLDFEMWRDATLAVTGQLELTVGGPSKPVDDLANVRRAIYVTVAREELHPIMRMHDFPEASAHSPRREATTTPLQQLFVLNSPWMERQAEIMWNRLKPLATDAARIETCYRLMFSRLPTPAEQQVAIRFLTTSNESGAPINSENQWKDYLQALLGLNEFHFVD